MIEPVKKIYSVNNRESRGFNSYHKAQVQKISEIRYAKESDKYLEEPEPLAWYIPYLVITAIIILVCLINAGIEWLARL